MEYSLFLTYSCRPFYRADWVFVHSMGIKEVGWGMEEGVWRCDVNPRNPSLTGYSASGTKESTYQDNSAFSYGITRLHWRIPLDQISRLVHPNMKHFLIFYQQIFFMILIRGIWDLNIKRNSNHS